MATLCQYRQKTVRKGWARSLEFVHTSTSGHVAKPLGITSAHYQSHFAQETIYKSDADHPRDQFEGAILV